MQLTKLQQKTLHAKWIFWNEGQTYLAFRRKVKPVFMGQGAVQVPWNGLWLIIELDGYTRA